MTHVAISVKNNRNKIFFAYRSALVQTKNRTAKELRIKEKAKYNSKNKSNFNLFCHVIIGEGSQIKSVLYIKPKITKKREKKEIF